MHGRALRAAAVVAALLLGACGGLSTSGPVRSGLEVGSGEAAELRQFFPGPQPGSGTAGIVQGFVRAGAATDGTYATARRFLTPAASESWNPDATLVIQANDAAPTVTRVDDTTTRLTVDVAGTVGPDGRYTAAAPGEEMSVEFVLASVDGEWRIDGLPESFGRFIKSSDVPRLVRPFAIHYVSSSRRATVPDVRWFPLDRLASRLARAQLEPVPDFLGGAAVTAVPDGARLLGDAISVSPNGVAAVNLLSDPLEAGEVTRQNLWAQFVRTLTQDPEVLAVSLAVDGVPVDLDGLDGPVSTLSQIGFPTPVPETTATKPVVRRDGQIVVFDPGARTQNRADPAQPAVYPDVPAGYSRLALSADGAELAAVDPDGDGISRWRDGTRVGVAGLGERVGAPAYDRRSFLWVGSVGPDPDALFVVDTRVDPTAEAAAATPVVAPWLEGRRVVESRVAADGDRVAVLSTRDDGTGPRVDLAGVVRGEEGRPQRLADPLRLGLEFSSARGLVWLGDQTLATVAGVGGSAPRPTVLTVGGDVQVLAEVPGARDVATTGGERDLYVVTEDGRLFMRVGPQWLESGPADDLAAAAG